MAEKNNFANLTITLPTLNEEGNIVPLIEALQSQLPGCQVVVVDDSSTDNTARRVRALVATSPNVRLIERTGVPCLTESIQAGIDASTTEYVAWCDADFSHPPEVMRQLYEVAGQSGCCIATRYACTGYSRRSRLPKGEMLAAALSLVLNFSVKRLLKLNITDYTSGFIVCRRDRLANHRLTGDYGEYFIELMYFLTRSGTTIEEVYCEKPPRHWGESKTGTTYPILIRRGVKYLWLVSRLMLRQTLLGSHSPSTYTGRQTS